MNEIIECHELILQFESIYKKETNIVKQYKYKDIIKSLKQNWIELTECEYPMVKNKNNKLVNIKTLIREQNAQNKKLLKNKPVPVYQSPKLDDIVNRALEQSKLVSSLYDNEFVSDVPDPYRKRKK